jgi:hypothetical protein
VSAQLTLFDSTVSSTSVIGLEVKVPWQPCRCGAVTATIGSSAGPHHASLHCARCDNFRGWLCAESYRFINAVIDEFGRPDQPITVKLRNSRISADV